MKPYKAILFDLDGTLVNTVPDFAFTINCLLEEYKKPLINEIALKPYAGMGATPMIKFAFGFDENDAEFPSIRKKLLDHYEKNIAKYTLPFNGIREVINKLHQNNIGWAIVTNKPGYLTTLLLNEMKFEPEPKCIVAGDTLAKAKPHPEPILHACNQMKHSPEQCLFIGDTHVDVKAAKAAGMQVLVATYGYIGIDENPLDWQADGYIKEPIEILDWV